MRGRLRMRGCHAAKLDGLRHAELAFRGAAQELALARAGKAIQALVFDRHAAQWHMDETTDQQEGPGARRARPRGNVHHIAHQYGEMGKKCDGSSADRQVSTRAAN